MAAVRKYGKTAPKVRDGKVQRKNRWALTPTYYNTPQSYPVFDREKPGRGNRHLIRKRDLYGFVDILPEWEELSKGLNAVVLASGEDDCMGWHSPGVVAICAWDRKIYWEACSPDFYKEHKNLLHKLGIPCERRGKYWFVDYNEKTARAFQLIHIFIHELGHHHDRMTTRSKRVSRGEKYAEQYAIRYQDIILERYMNEFPLY